MDQTFAALVDAYEEAVRAVAALAATCPTEQWGRPTDCPGWTVRDQVAHVLSLEAHFAGDPLPPPLDEYGPHVRNEAGQRVERGVVAYRRDDPQQAAAELAEVADRRFTALRAEPIEAGAATAGVMGSPVPWERFLPVRVFDVWTHEQDIRHALGLPARVEGAAAAVSCGAIVVALPMVVARLASAPAGSRVAFDVDGGQRIALTVRVEDDGRGVAHDGVTGEADVVVRTSFDTFARLACGRIDPATADVTVDGDQELGRRVLAALAITP